ncbi:MAG: hypothetical protein JXB88_14725 [Spirochaetales bacterium]|nr:hypothetical protein [Spirochaetales bacterium]
MKEKDFFTLQEFSELCELEMDFLQDLVQFGLIKITLEGKNRGVYREELECVRLIKRLYFDLGVNKEGIEIILSMRNQIMELHKQVDDLGREVNRLNKEQNFRNIEIILEKGLMIDV